MIVNTVDLGLPVQAAVDAPRLQGADGVVAVEPSTKRPLATAGLARSPGSAPGTRTSAAARPVARHPASRALSGGADARRGGAVRYAR